MCKQITRTLMLLTVTFMIAVLTLSAAPPEGKGGGKGDKDEGLMVAGIGYLAQFCPIRRLARFVANIRRHRASIIDGEGLRKPLAVIVVAK